MSIENTRTTEHKILDLFIERWSPRAFIPTPITDEELFSILEAGKWAPSAGNSQPWKMVYAKREDETWDKFVDNLVPPNQVWAKNASALVFVCSEKEITFPGQTEAKPATHASFDAGCAWGYMALQATSLGLKAHGMAGIDIEKIKATLNVPDSLKIEMAFAIGKQGDKSTLPEPYQAREAPSPRRPISETAFRGSF